MLKSIYKLTDCDNFPKSVNDKPQQKKEKQNTKKSGIFNHLICAKFYTETKFAEIR